MSPLLYLDAEFSRFEAPQLISLGLVSDSGDELYLELEASALPGSMSTFVEDTVVPQFGIVPVAVDSIASLGVRLGQWLLSLSSSESRIEVRYDWGTDFALLEHTLRAAGLWGELERRLIPTHIGYCIAEPEAVTASEESWAASFAADGIARHHALADARALRAAFHATHADRAASAESEVTEPESGWFDRTVERVVKGRPS